MKADKKPTVKSNHTQGEKQAVETSLPESSNGNSNLKISQIKKVNGKQNFSNSKILSTEESMESQADNSNNNEDLKRENKKARGKRPSKNFKKSNGKQVESKNGLDFDKLNETQESKKKLNIDGESFTSSESIEKKDSAHETIEMSDFIPVTYIELTKAIKEAISKHDIQYLPPKLFKFNKDMALKAMTEFGPKVAKPLLFLILKSISNGTLGSRTYFLWVKIICKLFPDLIKNDYDLQRNLKIFLGASGSRMETQKSLIKLSSRIQLIVSQRSQQKHLQPEIQLLKASINESERHNQNLLDQIEPMQVEKEEDDEEDENVSDKDGKNYIEDFDDDYSSDFEEELTLDANSKRRYQEISDSEE